RSKKLFAVYSLSRSGDAPSSESRTVCSCLVSAPGGVGPSIVHCHKSQNEHVNGHSAPVRNTVSDCSTLPPGRRSCSSREPCAVYGSDRAFGGRRARIRRSTSEAVTPQRRAASRSDGGSASRLRERAGRFRSPK